MSALIIAAIAVASIAAYLFTGYRIAIRQLPQAWAIARQVWSGDGTYTRGSVRQQTGCMIFFWPLILLGRRVRLRMDVLIDTGDPVALARKVAERDKRIAQLERELGIGK